MEFKIPDIYISKNICYLREKKNMTQEQLGKLLDKDYSSIGKWENNINRPSIEDTFKLAIIFNVDWKDFVLSDMSIPKSEYDNQIKTFATNKGVQVLIDKKSPLTAESVVEVQKILMEELEKENKK